ncbi:hypothetical protein CELL_03200 [Cellulomonas sp. T2.31MG-18]|uniref:hypothetical protein n=1 Tax=Cellulomonas sp. T2.31MG-18 TaxID=3157619 RepID=UPI0035E75C18
MNAKRLMHPPRLRGARDLTGGRPPTTSELEWAIQIVDNLGSGFLNGLTDAVGENLGRPGSVLARHVLIAWLLTAYEPTATAAHVRVVQNLLSLTPAQREQIRLPELPANRAYARVWDKTDAVIKALDAGFEIPVGSGVVRVDLDWFVDALMTSAIPEHLPTSRTRAVDGTDWETCGQFVAATREYDGETPADTDGDVEEHHKKVVALRRSLKDRVPLGLDGRPIYTKDCDARAGHRSANNRHSASLYIGYELHLGVQVRDFGYQGKPNEVVLGTDVPNFITMARLTPAGADRVDAVVPALAKEVVPAAGGRWAPDGQGDALASVIWDRGYSILDYSRGAGALRAAGITAVFDLSTRQRTLKAIYRDIDFIDGTPFSKHMPPELRSLPRLESHDTPQEREAKIAAFDRRAIWRWTPFGSTSDGLRRRWQCPFCAGRLRIADRPTRRANVSAPVVELPDGVACCAGTVTLPDDAVHLEQASGLLWGTSAHTAVYGQRSLVENANNLVHDKYVHLDRGYTKLMGLAKRKFVLAFLLAGVNRKIAESWEAREAARGGHENRVAAYQAQLRGEPSPAAPSAAALRQRRSRAARRAKADATSPASRGRTRTAPRLAASRQ